MSTDKLQQMVTDQCASIASQPIVKVNRLQDDQILINGKLVYKDMEEKWITSEPLNHSERRAFHNEINGLKS